MSLNKKYRVLSEKITSVDDPIEWTQKGQVQMVKASTSGFVYIPTTIKKPQTVVLNPHQTAFGKATAGILPYVDIVTANKPESGVKLYSFASAKASTYLTSASMTLLNQGGLFITSDNKLYRKKTTTASSSSISVYLASETLKTTNFEEVPYTDEVKFIKVLGLTETKRSMSFSFEVKGY